MYLGIREGGRNREKRPNVEGFHGASTPNEIMLFASLEACGAVQRTSTMRPLPCDCTEPYIEYEGEDMNLRPPQGIQTLTLRVLTVQPTAMSSTSCSGPGIPPYPDMLYYPVPIDRASTTERDMVANTQHRPISDEDSDMRKTSVARKLNFSTPEPTTARRRLRAGHRMAAATRLNSQVAKRVIKYARYITNIYDHYMGCVNCGLLPISPITGQCGHTLCSQCVANMTTCPCGRNYTTELNVNILIRDVIAKTTSDANTRIEPVQTSVDTNSASKSLQPLSGPGGSCRSHIRLKRRVRTGMFELGGHKRIPMSPRARYNHALDLLRLGHHREAVPYLALAAASGQPDLRRAQALLAQTITVLSNHHDPRRLTTQLTRSVRRLSSTSWIKPVDMECVLCRDTFTNPVTTPCGHMFCRTCIERTMDYGKRCPLCLQGLDEFNLSETRTTLFVQAALRSINAIVPSVPLEPDLIPIFVCTVAYPSVPCPLFIFDPRYWLMIRRVLESGSRRFGMVACDRDQDYVDYGTILEVRDCVQLEDGRSILSTVGISRFKVIERGVRDGCDVARILPITDVRISIRDDVWDIKMRAERIMIKALMWLKRLNAKVRDDIEAAFGAFKSHGFTNSWWETTDGPTWLWWLVAVLPLRSEIKVLILSTTSLNKRLMAVARTLQAVSKSDFVRNLAQNSNAEHTN